MADFNGNFIFAPRVFRGSFDNNNFPGNFVRGVGGSGGGSAPVIAFVDPLPGNVVTPNQPLVISVTDADMDLILVNFSAAFPFGVEEVVRRNNEFTPQYSGSTITNITNGIQLSIRRNGGWPGSPTINADVVDSTGNLT